MTYRPDGWKTLKAKNHPLHCLAPDECVGQAYESGADALLTALRKMGMPPYQSRNLVSENGQAIEPVLCRGTLVFIPDE